jgi:hypothetical protein
MSWFLRAVHELHAWVFFRMIIAPNNPSFQKSKCIGVPSFWWIFATTLFALIVSYGPRESNADEYSIWDQSSFLGQNYGLSPASEFREFRDVGDLSLIGETVFFTKNLELTGSSNIDGETFIGFVAPLRLNYLASKTTQIEFGGFLGRNYGDADQLDIAEPLARLIYQPIENHYFVAGTLFQTHWIHDALRDDVLIFREGSETGLQFRSNRESFKADYWIDWRLNETAERSEQFDGAGANQIRLGSFWIDGQFFWSHTGGQMNTQGQIANSSSWLVGVSYGSAGDTRFGQVRAGANYIGSHFESRTAATTDGSGVEYWLRCSVPFDASNQVNVFAKHYEGNGLFSLLGDPLYRFDQYSQVGFDWLMRLRGGVGVEFGIVGQHVDNTFMNTYRINFVWQDRFRLTNLRHRQSLSECVDCEVVVP